jgi:hypothetical protein
VVVAGEQVPLPSQVRGATRESPMQPPAAHCVPAATGAQWPTWPARLHDTQGPPVQAASQQTPCGAQKPEVQSLGAAHGWPSARMPQLEPVHTAGGAQLLAGGVQLVAHAVALPQV